MHRWVDHTAELELELSAPDEAGVFAEALAAVAELLSDAEPGGDPVSRDVAVESADRPALLADWLGELLFLAETEDLVPERAGELHLDGNRLRARVQGRRGAVRPYVKAVTYHGLVLEPAGGGWHARVVLDV
jgi:SHS2 domain-containing protein